MPRLLDDYAPRLTPVGAIVRAVARQKRIEGAETSFTLKFSEAERALVGRLVEARAEELRASGITEPVTIASYLRSLIHRDAQARGLDAGGTAPEKRRRR